MVDAMLEFMLGPLRGITDFYMDNQLILGSLIIGTAIVKFYFFRKPEEEKE